jgi:ribonucleotide reductase alpha subunit
MSVGDPLLKYCSDLGYTVEWVRNLDGSRSDTTKLVEFPCQFPQGTVLAEDVSAVQQMELQRTLQEQWADNSVSVTIYIKPGELREVRDYLESHWRTMKSVSFLLHTTHGFDQAPLESITKEEYTLMVEGLVTSTEGPQGGMSELLDDECLSGSCPIR